MSDAPRATSVFDPPWGTEAPTSPGTYEMRLPGTPARRVEVVEVQGHMGVYEPTQPDGTEVAPIDLRDLAGAEWRGPITYPARPK